MKNKKIIEKWESMKMSSFIGNATVDKETMGSIQGGIGSGLIKTISGDCNSTGESCWISLAKAAQKLFS